VVTACRAAGGRRQQRGGGFADVGRGIAGGGPPDQRFEGGEGVLGAAEVGQDLQADAFDRLGAKRLLLDGDGLCGGGAEAERGGGFLAHLRRRIALEGAGEPGIDPGIVDPAQRGHGARPQHRRAVRHGAELRSRR
jgi:hypothetical protein